MVTILSVNNIGIIINYSYLDKSKQCYATKHEILNFGDLTSNEMDILMRQFPDETPIPVKVIETIRGRRFFIEADFIKKMDILHPLVQEFRAVEEEYIKVNANFHAELRM